NFLGSSQPAPGTPLRFTALLGQGGGGKTAYEGIRLQVDEDILELSFDETKVSRFVINGKRYDGRGFAKIELAPVQKLFPTLLYQHGTDLNVIAPTGANVEELASTFIDFAAEQHADVKVPRGALSALLKTGIEAGPIPFVPRRELLNYLQSRPDFKKG